MLAVTLVQRAPASRVIWSCPSFVPAQTRLLSRGGEDETLAVGEGDAHELTHEGRHAVRFVALHVLPDGGANFLPTRLKSMS